MAEIQKSQRVSIFVSYAHQDEELLKELLKQLSFLNRLELATLWYNRDIPSGGEWKKAIHHNLDTAHLILLLISANFVASKYCYEIEMKRALERYDSGEALVIPIILRPTHWLKLPISKLQALPKDGKPVVQWPSLDEAFLDIANGIFKEIKGIQAKQTQGNRHADSLTTDVRQRIEQAKSSQTPEIIGQAEHSPAPGHAGSFIEQGLALFRAGNYGQALQAYEKARDLDPQNSTIYQAMGDTQAQLERLGEAFALYKQAAQVEASNYLAKGNMLRTLGEYDIALEAYDIALDLAPTMAEIFLRKGDLYAHIGQWPEALDAYEQARELLDD